MTSNYVLLIWTREDYGNHAPTLGISGNSREDLESKFYHYLYDHRDEEDYMNDEEFDEFMQDFDHLIDYGSPELNCAYIIHLMEL